MKIFKNHLHFVILTLIIILSFFPCIGCAHFQENILSDNQDNVFILNDNNDTNPPETKISLRGNMSEFGIFTDNVEVTLNATDDLSGVNVTYYDLDIFEHKIYTEPFLVSGHDEHILAYWSVDNAGNRENTNFFYIPIDLIPPEIHLYYKILKNNSIEFNAYTSDSGSGDHKVEYYIDNEYMSTKYWKNVSYKWIWTPPGPGYYTASGIVYDRAEHTGQDEIPINIPRIRIDTNQWFLRFFKCFLMLERLFAFLK